MYAYGMSSYMRMECGQTYAGRIYAYGMTCAVFLLRKLLISPLVPCTGWAIKSKP